MSGLISLPYFVTFLALIAAVTTDLRRGKIYNWLTIPVFLAGLVYSFSFNGIEGLLSIGKSIGIVTLIFGFLYLIRILAAGDVKLLMAMAAWLPPSQIVPIAVVSVLIGGILSFIFLWKKNQIKGLLSRVREQKNLNSMPFGISIALAFVSVVLYFEVFK